MQTSPVMNLSLDGHGNGVAWDLVRLRKEIVVIKYPPTEEKIMSTVKILAIEPVNGSAFIDIDGIISMIRAPCFAPIYASNSRDVNKGIAEHGFEPRDVSFNSITEVIQYIKEQYVTSMKERGVIIPPLESLRGLLNFADRDTLQSLLERALNELSELKARFPG